jgi:hypothetical protein
MEQKPSVGRIVHYRLAQGDVSQIEDQSPSRDQRSGLTCRNPVSVGQVYPAQIVAVFSGGSGSCNLVVQLDGTVQYWATSRAHGNEPGQWAWPERV